LAAAAKTDHLQSLYNGERTLFLHLDTPKSTEIAGVSKNTASHAAIDMVVEPGMILIAAMAGSVH